MRKLLAGHIRDVIILLPISQLRTIRRDGVTAISNYDDPSRLDGTSNATLLYKSSTAIY